MESFCHARGSHGIGIILLRTWITRYWNHSATHVDHTVLESFCHARGSHGIVIILPCTWITRYWNHSCHARERNRVV